MTFSEKLQSLRKKNHLSQEQLAEQLGVSRQALSKWESGGSYPEMDKIIKISQMFSVTTDYLLKESETEEGTDYVENFTYSFEKVCNLLLPRREKMDILYQNATLYDATYDKEQDDRVADYWKRVLKDCEVRSILDCSIGTGQMTLALAKLGYWLSGSDLSREMLKKCRQNVNERGLHVKLYQCDFKELSSHIEERFDMVASTGNSLPHVTNEEIKRTLSEMDKLVNPGGYLYFDVRNWDKILRDHQRFFCYQPMYNNDERINLTQIWDYNLDGTITFNLLYTFEKDGKLYKKETTSVYYYPVSRSFLKQAIRELGYEICREEAQIGAEHISIEETDWYYILARKKLE